MWGEYKGGVKGLTGVGQNLSRCVLMVRIKSPANVIAAIVNTSGLI